MSSYVHTDAHRILVSSLVGLLVISTKDWERMNFSFTGSKTQERTGKRTKIKEGCIWITENGSAESCPAKTNGKG